MQKKLNEKKWNPKKRQCTKKIQMQKNAKGGLNSFTSASLHKVRNCDEGPKPFCYNVTLENHINAHRTKLHSESKIFPLPCYS